MKEKSYFDKIEEEIFSLEYYIEKMNSEFENVLFRLDSLKSLVQAEKRFKILEDEKLINSKNE